MATDKTSDEIGRYERLSDKIVRGAIRKAHHRGRCARRPCDQ